MINKQQKTKLFIPSTQTRLVKRSWLLERLNAIQLPGSKVGLISAPAGMGKTTLALQWLESQVDCPVGWVSLDERDNLPALFFRYLISALQTILPKAGNEALEILKLPGVKLEEVVMLLVNDLAIAPGQFILVLDDFHTITNPALHQALDLFLEAQPPQMRILFISREDPALPLARRRAGGQLVELRQADLRFSLPEAVAFLNQSMDLNLSIEQVEILESRTEGWIAGLQMAALSLQHAPDVDKVIRGFSGRHHFILDYLMEEVFANQPEDVQRFLLDTSILKQMCAGLCAAVTGNKINEAHNFLDVLDKANLFVFSLDEEHYWYRYHHLFNDLLLARLKREDPDRFTYLYRSASDWYEQNGDARLAVEYALKTQDMSHTADLIERHITERWQNADVEFMSYVNSIPNEVIFRRPNLCLYRAWVCVISGQARKLLPFLEAAEQLLAETDRKPEPNDDTNRAFSKVLRAYLADLQNQPVKLDRSFQEAYKTIFEDNIGMKNSVAIVLGTIHYMEGDFGDAMCYFKDALERDKRINGTNAVPISVMRMIWVLQKQGRLHQAFELVTRNEHYVSQREGRRFYIAGVLNLLWGEILFEWNQLNEAEDQVQKGLRLLEDWPNSQTLCFGYSLLARLQTSKNDLAGARTTISQAEGLQRNSDFHPEFIYMLKRANIQLWLSEQNQQAMEAFVRDTVAQTALEPSFRHEALLIELCRVWLALGNNQKAAVLLQRLAATTGERSGSRIAILALLAAAHHDDPALAEGLLDEALRLGKPEGYIRTFLDSGETLRYILRAWLQHNSKSGKDALRAYAQRVLQGFESPERMFTKEKTQDALFEPLSLREQEVLQLVAEGLTNQQIAARLIISIRTVKKHVENIHGKLGVHNRTQAAAKARALGLLSPNNQ